MTLAERVAAGKRSAPGVKRARGTVSLSPPWLHDGAPRFRSGSASHLLLRRETSLDQQIAPAQTYFGQTSDFLACDVAA